eukprot:1015541-Pyramimonas_sp.AAC.1
MGTDDAVLADGSLGGLDPSIALNCIQFCYDDSEWRLVGAPLTGELDGASSARGPASTQSHTEVER